ncbi:MAG: hypothetical protein ACJ8DU_20425 [Microvirga sp.]|jgi:hypothetical protein|nr:hypothetical protein [Beijerinckiaceae bacterium]
MAIVRKRTPPGSGPQAIDRALQALAPAESAAALSDRPLNLSQPLPVYRLGLDQLDGPESLARATQSGWRYLIEGGEGTAYADVRETGADSAKFTSLSRNRNAERLMQAVHLAEEAARAMPDDCEARILEVPALYIAAIWLTGAQPVFIPYLDPSRLADEAAPVRVEPDLMARLVDEARAARRGTP